MIPEMRDGMLRYGRDMGVNSWKHNMSDMIKMLSKMVKFIYVFYVVLKLWSWDIRGWSGEQ